MTTPFVTYHINSDLQDKLKSNAQLACNFWNKYLIPKEFIVLQLGVFTDLQSHNGLMRVASAYAPHRNAGIAYGQIEFNTVFLNTFSDEEITGTLMHEIGHTLGIGWEIWNGLYDRRTGQFTQVAISKLPALANMSVELDYEPGTRYSHWDEEQFDLELMTGIKDQVGEYVLPVTIDVMSLFGNQIKERLTQQTSIKDLIPVLKQMEFTRQADANSLDKGYYQQTPVIEEMAFPVPA